MVKRFVPYVSSLVLAIGFLVGCQDAPTAGPGSSSSTTSANDAYVGYELVTASLATDFNDAPTFEDVMSGAAFGDAPSVLGPGDKRGPGGDSAGHDSVGRGGKGPRDTTKHGDDSVRHGGKGPRDSVKHEDSVRGGKGPRDTTKHGGDNRGPGNPRDSVKHQRPINYGRIISQLGLTREQDSLVRLCFKDFRECTHDAAMRYRNARKELRDSLNAALREIHQAVKNGTMTREEARHKIERLVAKYRQDGEVLQAAYKRAIEQCEHEFQRCVRSHLTPEQIRKWEMLLHR